MPAELDVSKIQMQEPPKIDDLTSDQAEEYMRCYDAMIAQCDKVEDALMQAGLSVVHATSASAHLIMNALARQALVTATLDGREPNREWFLHNCAAAFDRWVDAQSDPN